MTHILLEPAENLFSISFPKITYIFEYFLAILSFPLSGSSSSGSSSSSSDTDAQDKKNSLRKSSSPPASLDCVSAMLLDTKPDELIDQIFIILDDAEVIYMVYSFAATQLTIGNNEQGNKKLFRDILSTNS